MKISGAVWALVSAIVVIVGSAELPGMPRALPAYQGHPPIARTFTAAPPPSPRSAPATVRAFAPSIMPLGDSITEGVMPGLDDGGYRSRLDPTFPYPHSWVGSLTDAQGRKHEGHSGWKLTDLIPAVAGWVGTTQPKYILLHAGTNDSGAGRSSAQMTADLQTLLDTIHSASPGSLVILAQIPEVPNNPEVENAALRGYNSSMTTDVVPSRASWVRLVDQSHTEISTDGIHPSATGYGQMATVWRKAFPE